MTRGVVRRGARWLWAALPSVLAAVPSYAEEESFGDRIAALRSRIFASERREATALASELHDVLTEMAGGALAADDATDALRTAYLMGVDTLTRLPPSLRPDRFDAVSELERADALAASRLDDPVYSAHVAWQLGQALRDEGRLDEAMSTYLEAAEREPPAVTMRPSLFVVASQIAVGRSAFEEAMALLDRAEAAAEDCPDGWRDERSVRCSIASFRAEALMALGLPDLAASFVEEEERLARALKSAALIGTSYVRRADLLLATGRYEALERLVDRANGDEAMELRPDLLRLLDVRRAIGLAEHGRADREANARARDRIEALVERRDLSGLHRMRAEATLAQLALRDGDVPAARAWIDGAVERLGALRAADPSGLGPLEDGAFVPAVASAVARAEGRPREVLAEQLARAEAAFERFLAHWSRTPLRSGGVGFLHYGKRRQIIAELIRLTLAVHPGEAGRRRALSIALRVEAMGSTARTLAIEPPPIEEVRALLTGEGRGLLVYVPPGPAGGHVFGVDAARIVHAETPGIDAIDARRRDLAVALRRAARAEGDDARAEGEWTGLADALGEKLLPAEVARAIAGWDAVTVVGRHGLGDVPFDLLPIGDGERLGRAKALSLLPSVPVGIALARRERDALPADGPDVFAVLTPEVDHALAADWPEATSIPLPDDDRDRLLESFGARRVVRSGGDATPAALLDPKLAGARALLVLAHGVYDPGRTGGGAALLLAGPDGLVRSPDLERIDAPPLVVLLACGAGRGPVRRGDDGVGRLGESFLLRGARAVVAADADLELGATLDLMEEFGARLAAGASPAEALRGARDRLARDGRHPASRVRVQLIGLGDRPLPKPR